VRFSLAVLDMAGTTVADEGLVELAFSRALSQAGVDEADPRRPAMLEHVRATMGESKISVFRTLFDGDEASAQRVNLAFEDAYAALVDSGRCRPVDGAAEAIGVLREAGVKVALTTGFSRTTQDAILDALGWQDLADLALCPADAGRGRPYPDLALTAVLRLGVDDVREVATAGDTAYDVLAGLRAGASVAAGVLTGAHDETRLRDAGATHVLESVRLLPDLLLPERVLA
jgi:phosphonatase-like hydrolase